VGKKIANWQYLEHLQNKNKGLDAVSYPARNIFLIFQ